jgi:hypothetical protein
MKTKQFNFIKILIITLILTISMACNISFGPDNDDQASRDLMETQVILSFTQTALADQVNQSQATQNESGNAQESTQAPIVETTPSPISPTAEPDFCFENVCFSYDPSLASDVYGSQVPGQSDQFPNPYPDNTECRFEGYPLQNTFHEPRLIVYPVAEFEAISEYAAERIAELGVLLDTQPAQASPVPALPLWNAAQMTQSQIAYLEFEGGKGVRFLTQYGQAFWPINNQDLFYSFQGLTDDGNYVIVGIFPVTNPVLIDDANSFMEGQDINTFADNFINYVAEIETQLNNQQPNSFTPSLLLLDELFESLQIQ